MKQKKNPIEGFYSISQVANLLHVSTHSIRNLEREFSLEVTKDSDGNRIYDLETIEKYRSLIQRKNEAKFSKFELTNSQEKNNESFKYMSEIADLSVSKDSNDEEDVDVLIESENTHNHKTLSYNKNSNREDNNYSTSFSDLRNILPSFSSLNLVRFTSRLFGIVSFTVVSIFSLALIGIVSLNTFLKDFDPKQVLASYDRKSMSNVLQSNTEDWSYRFDVNVPAYMNNSLNVSGTLAGSNANFQIITVGQVSISQTGISAPNVVNLITTKAGETVILVDNTNRNQPTITLAANPEFDNVSIKNLNGVTQLDATTLKTIQDNIKVPTANADAQTLGGFASTDFLRSNANTVYTGGTLEFSPTSTVKFSNLSSNTFLRLNSQNVLTSYDITAGTNISITSTANSLIISASTGATSNVFSSAAVKDLFLGSTSFDENYRLVATASEINKLHTLSGNLITSTNLSANILSLFPNVDTNASDDLDNAVLITSIGGKSIYSTNTWYGTQDFSKIKAENIEVEENGYIKLISGSTPVITNSALYHSGNRLYFEDLPLVQIAGTSINDNVNRLAYFVTNASGELLIQGTSSLALDVFETGSNGQIIGVFGNSTKYLTINGDLSVSSTSSSQITFQLNNVNTNPGTFGSSSFTPVITVNSKGQVTSISTVASSSNNFTSSISFSAPESGRRDLILQRNGLSNLTASFSLSSSDIVTALGYTPQTNLGYTPLKNTSDTLSGNLVITQTLASISIYQNGSLVCDRSGNCSDIYTDTTNANNYVTAIAFSDSAPAQKSFIISRNGLSNLTALFSISSSDVVTALGYTPLQASDTAADKFINSFGLSNTFSSQNVSYFFSIARNDGTTFPVNFALTPAVITTALGYTPFNSTAFNAANITSAIGYVPFNSTAFNAANITSAIGYVPFNSTAFNAANITSAIGYVPFNSTSFNALNITNALGYIPFGPSNFIAGSNITLSSTATSLTINSSYVDTTNANNFVTDITFSTPAAAQRTLTLTRTGLSNLTATFSMTSSDVVTALGYTPLQASDTAADKFINSFGLSNTFSSQNVSYFFSIARNDGTTFPVNFALTPAVITTALGYTPLKNTTDTLSGNLIITGSLSASTIFQNGNRVCDLSGNCAGSGGTILGSGNSGYISLFTATNSIGNSEIFQTGSNIGIGLTNPGEKLDVYGAIRLSQDMGTGARSSALYQSNGVLYWNGQAVGVVGSTAPGGISGTKDYLPYFNTANTLIATEFRYTSNSTERGLDLSSQNNLEVYLGIGHQNDISAKFGVASNDEASSYYSRFESHDDLIIENLSNRTTSDIIFSNKNILGSYLYTFGKNDSEAAGIIFKFNTSSNRALVGINTTNPSFNLEVIGSAKISETFAVSTFSNPSNNNFTFLSGANFSGNLSAGNATISGLSLANALPVIFGGTGLTAVPANGQLLIGNGTGYTLAPLTAGTNVSITTNGGTITISSTDTTNANNFVTDISFADVSATNRTLTLTRTGLSNLTATFSISSATVTTALGYTPLKNTTDSLTGNLGVSGNFSSANVYVSGNITGQVSSRILTGVGSVGAPGFSFNGYSSTGFYYVTDTTLRVAIAGVNTATFKSTGLLVNGNLTASSANITGIVNAATGSFTDMSLANALPVIFGGTGLSAQPANGQILIGNGTGYTLSALTAGSNISISTGAGSITISSTDTTNANNFVTSISFSDAAANNKVFTLNRSGTNALSAIFSLSTADVTTALGYTPLQASDTAADKFINSYGVATAYSSQNVTYNFSIARNDGTTFPASISLVPSVITTALGYVPFNSTSFNALNITNALGYIPFGPSNFIAGSNITLSSTATSLTINSSYVDTTNANNFVTSISFSDAAANNKVFTLNRSGTNALSAIFSLSTADVTTALGYTPLQASDTAADKFINSFGLSSSPSSQNVVFNFSIGRNDSTNFPTAFNLNPLVLTTALGYTPLNKAGDTVAGNLTVTGTLQTSIAVATISLSARHLFIADTNYTSKFLHIDPNLGNFDSKLILDMNVGSSINTTLGMYIQSVKFSSPGVLSKNLTFNVLDSALNTRLDVITTGTIPTINAGIFSLGGATVIGSNAVFDNLYTTSFSAATGSFTGNLSASTAFINGNFSAGNASLASLTLLGNFSGGNSTLAGLTLTGNFSASNAFIAGNAVFSDSSTIGASYFSSPLAVNTFNFAGGTIANAFFSSALSNNSFNFLGGTIASSNLSISGNAIFTSGSTIGASYFSSPLAVNTFNFAGGTIANAFFSSALSNNSFNFLGGTIASSNLSISGNAIFLTRSTIAASYFSSPLAANTFNFAGGTIANGFFSSPQSNNVYTFLGGTIASSNLSISGNALFTSRTTMAIGYFSSPLADNTFNFVGGTISASFFSTPSANNTFNFLGNVNFSGNLSAANGTFVSLSAQSLNVNNLFTVDASGSVFNNSVTFNDTIEFNAVGDLAVANDLVFTNTALSKIRTANDLILEIGEPFNSSNIVFNMFNAGEFIVNGDVQINGVVESLPTGFFSSPLSNNSFNFLGGTIASSNLSISGNAIFTSGSTIGASYFSSPLAANTFNFAGGTIANAFFSSPLSNNSFNFLGGTIASSNLSISGNAIFLTRSTIAASYFSSPLAANTFNFAGGTIANAFFSSALSNNSFNFLGGTIASSNGTFTGNFSIGGTLSARTLLITTQATGVTTNYLCTSSTGLVGSCSSSIKYKENIEDMTFGLKEVMQLRPVTFNLKEDGSKDFGFIAEEVYSVNPLFATGDIGNVKYPQLSALLVNAIKEQQTQLTNLSIAQSTIDFSQANSMYTSLMNTIDALAMSTDNGDLVVGTDLIINGKTILNEATFTGDVQLGQMKFDTLNNDLSVLGASCVRADGTLDDSLCQAQSLFLMKNKAGNLNIFDGKVVLKPNGDMQVEKINVTEIKADEYKVASNSQVSGSEILLANQTEIVINTSKIKSNSKVFVTASNNLEGKTLYVDEKIDGVSFKVKINQSMTSDVKFDWFILNVE